LVGQFVASRAGDDELEARQHFSDGRASWIFPGTVFLTTSARQRVKIEALSSQSEQ
jgi:hypothetical protein